MREFLTGSVTSVFFALRIDGVIRIDGDIPISTGKLSSACAYHCSASGPCALDDRRGTPGTDPEHHGRGHASAMPAIAGPKLEVLPAHDHGLQMVGQWAAPNCSTN